MAESLKSLRAKKAGNGAGKQKSANDSKTKKTIGKKSKTEQPKPEIEQPKTDLRQAYNHTTKEQVIEALNLKNGLVSLAAKHLGCTPQTIYNWRDKEPEVKDAIQNARNEIVDIAEHGLRGAVLKGEGWAVCFTLKTLGKERGYVETQKHEHFGKDGGAIEHKVSGEVLMVIQQIYGDGDGNE